MARAEDDGQADAGNRAGQQARILTVPNAISVARLAGVPVFLWLVLGPKADGWAVGLLVAAGLSDWLDGKIARAWNQTSALGQVLDPAADRLYIAATLAALALRAIIPWWLVGILVGRELVLAIALLVLNRYGYPALQVSFVGKAATLCLLYAFPLLFLGAHAGVPAESARVIGWAFAIWGSALYWWSGALYLIQAGRLVSEVRRAVEATRASALAPQRTPGDDGPYSPDRVTSDRKETGQR
ncbi:MAG TPA: CDP-alcohol phosphatidyltransferase family protein [Streptosporangiaceae bacterium]|nr:CDP-alcohol phosphatidyltransferase family protein [Streptosporangiaceae bacterium]